MGPLVVSFLHTVASYKHIAAQHRIFELQRLHKVDRTGFAGAFSPEIVSTQRSQTESPKSRQPRGSGSSARRAAFLHLRLMARGSWRMQPRGKLSSQSQFKHSSFEGVSMTQKGGPAAINGFLYQILQHISSLAEASLSTTSEDAGDATLVLVFEPAHGGDAQAFRGQHYVVEQYKRREQTISVSDIEEVLVDLRKAARIEHGDFARYRLVTNAGPGRIDGFNTFILAAKQAPSFGDLDDKVEHSIGQFSGTHRAYFDQILTKMASTGASPERREDTFFHVLNQLELVFNKDAEHIRDQLESVLRPYAPELGEEASVVDHLVGLLVRQLAKGSLQLDRREIDSLLKAARLNPSRMRNVLGLAQQMADMTQKKLAHERYDPALDVRVPIDIENTHVMMITGPSGSGKSWAVAKLAMACAQTRLLHCYLPTAKSVQDIREQVSKQVWNRGMRETSERSWESIRLFFKELEFSENIIVILDNVQDASLAREIGQHDWHDEGIQIVMAVPERVTTSLKVGRMKHIRFCTLGQFSVDELDTYLQLHGRSWHELPPDLKRLLRQPILAGLFVDLPYQTFALAPKSEYEIFDAFWNHIHHRGLAGDQGIVLALAGHFLEGKAYPLSRSDWSQVGLQDGKTAERLEISGWVRLDEFSAIELAHDRLLNWAVAKFILQKWQNREVETNGVITSTTGEAGTLKHDRQRRLPYLALDLLWMACETSFKKEKTIELFNAFETNVHFRSRFLEEMVPTLGDKILPILLTSLETSANIKNGRYRASQLGKAIAAIATQETTDCESIVHRLLAKADDSHLAVAHKILTRKPLLLSMDLVWESHQFLNKKLKSGTSGEAILRYRESLAALQSGVDQHPQWLRSRILNSNPQVEQISDLSYLLYNNSHPDAQAIWHDASETLKERIESDKLRGLFYCISRFGDSGDVDFLVAHLNESSDLAGSVAFIALCKIDPLRAIDELNSENIDTLEFTSNSWLPLLLYSQGPKLRARILTILNSEQDPVSQIATLFSDSPDQMGPYLLDLALRSLNKKILAQLDLPPNPEQDFHWITRYLPLFFKLCSHQMLQSLATESGKALSATLEQLELRRSRTNSRSLDRIGLDVKKYLLIAGAPELNTVLSHELSSSEFWVRHAGLQWSYTRNTPEIVSGLVSIASAAIAGRVADDEDSLATQELYAATIALAALAADTELVDLLKLSGTASVPRQLAQLRAFHGPMSTELTKGALKVLNTDDAAEDAREEALLIVWLSNDITFIPTVREALVRSTNASLAARYCCIALQTLGDSDPESVVLVEPLLDTENAFWAINFLLSLGEPGVPPLQRWLQRTGQRNRRTTDQLLRVLKDTSAANFVSATATDLCLGDDRLADLPFDLALVEQNVALSERIFDEAFAQPQMSRDQSIRAIEALSRVNTRRALQAAILALESMPENERSVCKLIVQMGSDNAIDALIEAAMRLQRDSLTNEIGRTFRLLDSAMVDRSLSNLLDGNLAERRLATQIAAWCAASHLIEKLSNALEKEHVPDIRLGLIRALRQRMKDNDLEAILVRASEGPLDTRWANLTLLLENADPFLLCDERDSLWLGKALTPDTPEILEYHANERLQTLQKEVNSKRRRPH